VAKAIHLPLRFLLEVASLVILGWWGASLGLPVAGRVVAAVALPAAAAVVWGVFRVPNDPGTALVAIPGPARLALETVFFAAAATALWTLRGAGATGAFAALVLVDYALSWQRVMRLAGG
jgi:hypothetical protein